MDNRDWKNAFGQPPEDFRAALGEALDNLEDRRMKKRTKFTTVLAAALIAAAVIAGAALAAGKLGVFRMMTDTVARMAPLEGAEALVATDLGAAENDYVKLTVEEAVYDGQGAIVQLRVAPKDPEHCALLNTMLHGASEEDYNVTITPARVPEGVSVEHLEEMMGCDIDEFTYVEDGVRYFTGQWNERVDGRKDGRTILGFMVDARVEGVDPEQAEAWEVETGNYLSSWGAEENDDGSVTLWGSGFSGRPMADELALTVTCGVSVGGEYDSESATQLELPITLRKGAAERRVRLVPEGDGAGERFSVLSAELTFTRVRGYLTVDYAYEQSEDEPMGITFEPYVDGAGAIPSGGGYGTFPGGEGDSVFRQVQEIQSLDPLPDAIVLEARVIGEDRALGRVKCRVVEE